MSGRFDGVDQSINLGTTVNFNGSLDTGSAWAWFRIASFTDGRIINKSDAFTNSSQTIQLAIVGSGGGTVKGILGGTAVTSTATIAFDIWHLLVITYDGSNVRLYFNAVLVDTVAKAGNLTTDVRNTRIGSSGQDTTARNLDGDVADVGITDTTLPLSVIQSMLQARGAFRTFGDIRYRWLINDREPGIVIGATSVANIGPVSIAKGSGTNSPTFENQRLSFVQPVF